MEGVESKPALLRPGLLEDVRAVVATAAGPAPAADAIERRTGELGARVRRCEVTAANEPLGEDETRAAAGAASDGAELLVVDGAALFAAAAGPEALLACMQASWDVTRAVASEGMLERGGGLVVLVAPPPGAGEQSEAARAGLENLARTLSIEWARFATRAVAVAPGDDTAPGALAELVAYLASPAGAYFSGCLLDLRGV